MTRLVVEADGGSRGNPGPAGWGAVVRDADTGAVLVERAAAIGVATNNVAEYGGVIAGLTACAELARDLEVEDVEVRMDSKLVVEQLSGRWKVKHPAMQPLAREARALLAGLPPTRFTWVPRDRNRHADRLANEAMDAAAAGETWAEPGALSAAITASTASATAASAPVADAVAAPAAYDARRAGWREAGAPGTTTLLLRHGQTALSVDKRFSGVGDPELTLVGRAQAAAAATRLAGDGVDLVVTSPLRRARQTAEAVARACGVELVVEDGLRETDFGVWEGLTFGEVRAQHREAMDAWLADQHVAPPGGESFVETTARVEQARDRVLSSYGGQRLVLVSHVTPIKTLLRLALDAGPSALHRIHLDLACLSDVTWWADGPTTVRSLNDTAHLAHLT